MTDFESLIAQKPKKVTKIGVGKFDAQMIEWEGGGKAVFKSRMRTDNLFRGIPRVDLHIREAVAYDMDQMLGFNLVPETRVGKLNGMDGSFQKYVPNAVLPYELVTGIFDKSLEDWRERVKRMQKMADTESTAKLVVFDLIVGNVDRHARNAMFTVGERKCVAIDNGCAFGRYLQYYRNVFHKYLFFYHFPVPKGVTERLRRVTLRDVQDVIQNHLPPISARHVYWRLRFTLEHLGDLSFKRLSKGHYKRDEFPAYKEYFKKRMHHAAPMGPIPVVFDTKLYQDTTPAKKEGIYV